MLSSQVKKFEKQFKNWLEEHGEQLREQLAASGEVDSIKKGGGDICIGGILGGVGAGGFALYTGSLALGVVTGATSIMLAPITACVAVGGLIAVAVASNWAREPAA